MVTEFDLDTAWFKLPIAEFDQSQLGYIKII